MEIKKIFSNEKCLNLFILNLFGFQCLRYLAAKFSFWFKYNFRNFDKENYIKLKSVFNKGYEIKNNFLDEKDFLELKKEFHIAIEQLGQRERQSDDEDQSGIEYLTLYVDDKLKEKFPKIYEFKQNTFIKQYFSTCEQKNNFNLYCRLEKIKVNNENIDDPNKDYHYDTFHDTFKCWLFLNKVEQEEGPFRYLPYSNKFSFRRLLFEWKQSMLFSLKKNINSSFRVNKNFKKKFDQKSVSMNVNENTLVMANTHGLHRRGDAKNGSIRYAIQFWTRENPFKIIFN